jgi:hypothetical protein
VRWYNPDASPDGRTVVFERRDGRGLPRLQLLDATTDKVVDGFERDGGSLARFVSPTDIWFHETGSCAGCTAPARGQGGIVSLDVARLTEEPISLAGFVTDVRQVPAGG